MKMNEDLLRADILRLMGDEDYGSIEEILEAHPDLTEKDIEDTIDYAINKSDAFRAGYWAGWLKYSSLHIAGDLIKTLKIWKHDGGRDWIEMVLESDILVDFMLKLEDEGLI